jgi:tetratricopeptide (TPR) repeat protein
MIEDFKRKAERLGRYVEPVNNQPIKVYDHWFKRAYPEPFERQEYLQKQIVSKYLSHASFRLAHILHSQLIVSLVVTPNFDDFLSRALRLFGDQPIVYDDPKTFARINDGYKDIQIVHVHGSYRFYDCCNLEGEILDQAQDHVGQPSQTAKTIASIFSQQSLLVVGYSGWEGDVIMTALKLALFRRLASNVYWFCYRESDVENLPNWLKSNTNVNFVMPSRSATNDERTGPQYARRSSGHDGTGNAESNVLPNIESTRLFTRKRRQPLLPAKDLFHKFIQTFSIEIPELTSDPLGFFVKQMSGSLPKGKDDEKVADIYSIGAVIDRIQRAKDYEDNQIAQKLESKLERVRNALRASDHAGLIQEASAIDPRQLSDDQRKRFISALWEALEEVYGDSKQELSAYDQIINAARLLKHSSFDKTTHLTFVKAFVGKGTCLRQQGDIDGAIAALDEVINRIKTPSDRELSEALVMALVNKGALLSGKKRNRQAISIYDHVISRFARSSDIQLQRGVIRALFNKAVNLRELNRDKDALPIYTHIVRRFAKVDDRDIQPLVAASMLNKAYTHGILNQRKLELRTYEQIVTKFELSDDPTLQEFVAKALVNKGIGFLRAGDYEESIRASDSVYSRFRTATDLSLLQYLSKALIVKGDSLVAQNRKNDAIRIYETVIYGFKGRTESVLKQSVAMSMIKMANQLENIQQASNLYDRVIEEFGNSPDQVLQEQVAIALINNGGRSYRADDFKEAVEFYDEVENRFARIGDPSVQALLATAMVNKSAVLIKINHNRSAIRALDEVIGRYFDNAEPSIQEQVASAFFNKLLALSKLKDWKKAEETYVQMIERYAETSDEVRQQRVINAMLQQSSNFNAADQRDRAIGILDEIFNRFAGSKHISTKKLVARAMISKGGLLGQMNRHRDAVDVYKVILHRVGKSTGEGANEIRASALNAIGFQLLCEAKLERSNGHEHSARSKLTRAEEKINAALERTPQIQMERALALGNLSYINFLSGNEVKARKLLNEALRIGGTVIRKAELKDTTIYPLDLDKGFRALIRSIG